MKMVKVMEKISRNIGILAREVQRSFPFMAEAERRYLVRYIDLRTGKTREETLTERELWDFYQRQRAGEVSVISIQRIGVAGQVDLEAEREEFWRMIDAAIEDEVKAYGEYSQLAKTAERLGFSISFVTALREIAEDEARHRATLESFRARGGF